MVLLDVSATYDGATPELFPCSIGITVIMLTLSPLLSNSIIALYIALFLLLKKHSSVRISLLSFILVGYDSKVPNTLSSQSSSHIFAILFVFVSSMIIYFYFLTN